MRAVRLIIWCVAAVAVAVAVGWADSGEGLAAPATGQVARFGDFDYGAPGAFDLSHAFAVSSVFWFPNQAAQESATATIAQIHARPPDDKVLAYMAPLVSPSVASAYYTCLPWSPDYPSSYYLTKVASRTVPISFVYGGISYFRLNPGVAAVQAACVATIEQIISSGGYDGVFLDFGPTSLELDRLTPGGCRESVCASEEAWQRGVESFYANVAAQLHRFRPGLLVLANIAGGGASPEVWRSYLDSGLDGAMEESFLYGTDHQFEPQLIAGQLRNVLWDESHGKLTVLNADIRPVYDTQANTLAAAMMMMVAGGRTEWVINDGDYGDPPRWLGIYTTLQRLGAPLGPYYHTRIGAYVRRFQNGYVLANPTATTVSAPSPLFGEIPALSATVDLSPTCSGCAASGIAGIVQEVITRFLADWPA